MKGTAEPHQDFAPVRGTRNTWTVWHWNPFTCGDVIMFHSAIHQGRDATADTIRLSSRPGISRQRAGAPMNRRGFLDGKLLASGELLDEHTVWHWNSPFTCGDVIMFHSLTIHQGRDNATADRIRLSTSARYRAGQRAGARSLRSRWDRRSAGPTGSNSTPAGRQPDDPLKYYWRSLDLTTVDP